MSAKVGVVAISGKAHCKRLPKETKVMIYYDILAIYFIKELFLTVVHQQLNGALRL